MLLNDLKVKGQIIKKKLCCLLEPRFNSSTYQKLFIYKMISKLKTINTIVCQQSAKRNNTDCNQAQVTRTD